MRLLFLILFLNFNLLAENFLDFAKNNVKKEQNTSQENPTKRIKIPTH
ncbi:hypothetical protein H2279_06255 [Campylobacter sp. B0100352/1]|nr:hypothetical protein [Campylobacter sp. B0100352/1]